MSLFERAIGKEKVEYLRSEWEFVENKIMQASNKENNQVSIDPRISRITSKKLRDEGFIVDNNRVTLYSGGKRVLTTLIYWTI